MFEIRYTVQQIKLNHFSIPLDIYYKVHNQNLMKQDWCDLVKAIGCSDVELESEHEQVLEMESCIADSQRLYRNDI